ncbi:23S rRNA (pseudouridine(1915)-N(3))-methyltransferase RlmH [Candidatus Saccharibacteria bacterium]|nr:23S rRNA (pseudouridine(1915)-N(3))-methyltransferase RlmH [Candidatus Saccharibacteria bacterium]
MIRIICGGKKNQDEYLSLINEYEKRLRKPFDISWEFVEEERLLERLDKWPYTGREFVICCDERGKNISSDEYSLLISNAFLDNRDVVILIGGAFGFTPEIREKADFVWSFSKLVFPHRLFRLMVVEQIYRAWEINRGSHYHHA